MPLKIDQYLDVLLVNGIYYLLRDSELRETVEGWSKSEVLDPTSEGFVSSKVIYNAIKELSDLTDSKFSNFNNLKLDKSVYNQLYSLLLDKRIAMTASYNDLVDVPSFGGAKIEGHELVFTGASYGQEEYLLNQIDLISDVIGTGVL